MFFQKKKNEGRGVHKTSFQLYSPPLVWGIRFRFRFRPISSLFLPQGIGVGDQVEIPIMYYKESNI